MLSQSPIVLVGFGSQAKAWALQASTLPAASSVMWALGQASCNRCWRWQVDSSSAREASSSSFCKSNSTWCTCNSCSKARASCAVSGDEAKSNKTLRAELASRPTRASWALLESWVRARSRKLGGVGVLDIDGWFMGCSGWILVQLASRKRNSKALAVLMSTKVSTAPLTVLASVL